jgi:hypothetical protein
MDSVIHLLINVNVMLDGLEKAVKKMCVLINVQVKENAQKMDVFATRDGNVNLVFINKLY